MNCFAAIKEHPINSSVDNKLCRVEGIEKNVYRVKLDGTFVGYIRKEGDGWILQEC